MIDRRSFIESAGLVGIGTAASAQSGAHVPAPPLRTVDVREFGAKADGETDDTAAFNRACQASAPWSEQLSYAIHVPSGRYRLDGTVFVRKGQTLFGDGHASHIDARRAKGPTFVLGRRAGPERGTPDPGGAPVRLSGFRSLGGAPGHGFVQTDAQGFSIAELFLTAVGIGIEIVGTPDTPTSDGIIRDIIIDQCLQGILVGKAQNLNFNSINIYMPRFAITIGDNAHDIIFSSVSINYTENVSVSISKGFVSNIIFANSTFVANAQYPEFIASVLSRMDRGDLVFTGCTFRNWPGTAIVQDRPGDTDIDFFNCVFDGSHTSTDYDWSRSSSVLNASSAGRFSFQGCTFRGLRGALARMGEGQGQLQIAGGLVEGVDENRLIVDRGFAGVIGIRNVAGFAPLRTTPGQAATVLPIWPGAGPWKVVVKLGEPEAFAEEAVIQLRGDTPVKVAGWRSSDDRQARFAVVGTRAAPLLQVTIATDRPEDARFWAETVC